MDQWIGAQPLFCESDAIMADNGAMLRSDIRRFLHFDDLPGHVMSCPFQLPTTTDRPMNGCARCNRA